MTTPILAAEGTPALSAPRRRRGRALVAGLALTVVALVIAGALVWKAWAADHPTPWSAIDAYTAAVGSGDRDSLESLVAQGPAHDALVARHAGKPASATTVTAEMTESSVWWSVEVRYELPGQVPSTERLFVGPRDDSPDHQLDYAVTAAPTS